jgi:hypothetical protein
VATLLANFKKTTFEIRDFLIMIIVAVVMLYILFEVIASVLTPSIGQLPAQVTGAILSLGIGAVYAVKAKINQQVAAWLKEK